MRMTIHGKAHRGWMALVVAACLSATAPVRADFHAERRDPTPQPAYDIQGFTAVTQIGSGSAEAVKGFGQRIPLSEAMLMLLPAQWSYAPGDHVGSPEVSWSASSTWLQALSSIGNVHRLRFLIDWHHHVVYAEPFRPATYGQVADGRKVNAEWADPDALLWRLKPGGLREQLEQWALRANYNLFWPEGIADIEIQLPATLRGSFTDVIRQVGESLAAVNAGVKLRPYPENRALIVQEY